MLKLSSLLSTVDSAIALDSTEPVQSCHGFICSSAGEEVDGRHISVAWYSCITPSGLLLRLLHIYAYILRM